jgi:adenine phosphoribosyltransferase
MREASEVERILVNRTREVLDFPSPGVRFKDLTPLFADPEAFGLVLGDIARRHHLRIDAIAGIEARGFIIGAPLAQQMRLPFVPIRKAGKLPGETWAEQYLLEYGSATIEVTVDAFAPSARVLVVDDVLATGGTAAAACRLVERAGARVTGVELLLELVALRGRETLAAYDLHVMHQVFD